jgi:diguanylate cyclase (GGDEF)-like protein/PAS domain S-box-containing protein
VRDLTPSWLATVAADYAAYGGLDDALVRAATLAEVGLVTVREDGGVWWSDETYRLHGRPRWRRVRSLEDLEWGLRDVAKVRTAYLASLNDIDLEVRYTAVGELGEHRDLVLRALDHGVAVVHRAAARATRQVVDVRAPSPGDGAGARVEGRERPAAGAAPPEGPAPDDAAQAVPRGSSVAPEAEAPPDVHDAVGSQPHGDTQAPSVERDATTVDESRLELASAVLSASPDLLLIYDLDTNHVLRMAGNETDAGELVAHLRSGGALREETHPDDVGALLEWREGFPTLLDGEVRTLDVRFPAGTAWRWSEIRASAFRRRADTSVREVVLIVRDVHERVEASHRLADSERAFREVFDASPIGLAVLDDNGRFTDVNDAFCKLVGRTREAVLATVYEALLHPQDRAAAVISRARRLAEGTSVTASDRRLVRADGAVIWVRMRTSDIDYEGLVRTLVSLEDVTSAKATEDQLRHDALHDELTGLPNRRLLIDRLERAIARTHRSGTRIAVFFIDLDDLKRVNDTHPWKHRAGDQLLTQTAAAVTEALREADTLGRLGGDEFVAVCEDVPDDATVVDIGARILGAATRPMTIGGETINPGASIGVAVSVDDDESAEDILRRADAAMYRAKSAGGSRLMRADDEIHPAGDGLELDAELARGELTQHYQPIVSLSTGAVLGVTTVARWRDPSRGALTASQYRAAIDTGASTVVMWSIEQAVQDVRTVAPTRVEHVSVWVPVPARAALATSTRHAVVAALRGPDGSLGGDSSPSLVLDVHERDAGTLVRRNRVNEHLEQLLESGPLAIGVDHFTANAVPLGMLQQVSAASISLDPLLLADAAQNPGTAEVVQALVTAAAALGVVSIAMDVESHEQLDLARTLGVHAVYGDLVGPPAPLDTYSDLLHGGRITLPAPQGAPSDQTTSYPLGHGLAEPEPSEDARAWAALMAERLAHDVPDVAEEATSDVVSAPVVTPEAPLSVEPGATPASPEAASEPAAPPAREAASGPQAPQTVEPEASTPSAPAIGDIGASLAAELGLDWPREP